MFSSWFRKCAILVALIVTVPTAFLLLTTTPAYAQENPEQQPAVEPEAPSSAPPAESTNVVWHMITSVGVFFGPLLAVISVGLVMLIVILWMELRMSRAIPPGFVEEFTDIVNKRQFKQAFDLCRNDDSFLARILTAGMGRLQYGIEDARYATRNMSESIRTSKEQLINFLATIGTLGPMLGLVGTVFGMILAFMRLSSGGLPDPAKLAGDISHALVVTLFGVALSVPAIFFNTFFQNRLKRMTKDTANLADDLLTQMYHNSRRTTPPTAAPAGAPAATAVPAKSTASAGNA